MKTATDLIAERSKLRLEVIANAHSCRVGCQDGAYLACATCGYPFDNGDRYWELQDDRAWNMYCSRACIQDDPATVERCVDIALERREDSKIEALLREAGDL